MRPARLLLPLVILLAGIWLYSGLRDGDEGGLGREPWVEFPAEPDPKELDAQYATETRDAVEREVVALPPAGGDAEGSAERQLVTTRLAGRVLDPAGTPLAGCEVVFLAGGAWIASSRESVDFPLDHAPRTTTGEEGGFAFVGVAPGDDHALLVRHPRLRPELVQGVVVDAFARSEEPPIVLREGKRVVGTVRDRNGAPIEGAWLHLDGAWMPTGPRPSLDRLSATTDALGRYELRGVPDGKRCLTVTAEGFGTLTRVQSLVINDKTGDTHIADFELGTAVELRGRVLDLAGEAVAGAELLLIDRAAYRDVAHGSATSAIDGSWAIEGLLPGSYELRVTSADHEEVVQRDVAVPREPWSLLLQPKRRIQGRVADAESGAGLGRFSLRLRRFEDGLGVTHPVGPLAEQVGGPLGEFSIPAESELGPWVVEARAAGYAPSYSPPFDGSLEGDVTGVQVDMRRGGELRGRLVDAEGRPVVGRVTCRDAAWVQDAMSAFLGEQGLGEATVRHLRCGADGGFVLSHLRPARYQLSARGPGLPERRLQGFEVVEGEALDLGEIVLPPGASVRGTIYGGDSMPIVGAMVFLQPADRHAGLALRRTKSGLGGAWRMGDVAAGTYLLSARPPDTDLGVFTFWPDRSGEELVLEAGVEDVRDLHLEGWSRPEPPPPPPPRGQVRGVLTRAGGEPVRGAPLELRAAGMGREAPHLAKTGLDGEFVFPAVEPGDYLLLPTGYEELAIDVSVRADVESEHRLELPE